MPKVVVYLNTGRTVEIEAAVPEQIAADICRGGVRREESGDVIWYPPHRIESVVIHGGVAAAAKPGAFTPIKNPRHAR